MSVHSRVIWRRRSVARGGRRAVVSAVIVTLAVFASPRPLASQELQPVDKPLCRGTMSVLFDVPSRLHLGEEEPLVFVGTRLTDKLTVARVMPVSYHLGQPAAGHQSSGRKVALASIGIGLMAVGAYLAFTKPRTESDTRCDPLPALPGRVGTCVPRVVIDPSGGWPTARTYVGLGFVLVGGAVSVAALR